MKDAIKVQRIKITENRPGLVYPSGFRFLKPDELTENGDVFTGTDKGLYWSNAVPGHKPFEGITYCRPVNL